MANVEMKDFTNLAIVNDKAEDENNQNYNALAADSI